MYVWWLCLCWTIVLLTDKVFQWVMNSCYSRRTLVEDQGVRSVMYLTCCVMTGVCWSFCIVIVPTGANIICLDLYEEFGYKFDIPTCHDADSCTDCNSLLVAGTSGTVVHHKFWSMFADLFQQPETLVGLEHMPKVDPQVVPRSHALRHVLIVLQEGWARCRLACWERA